MPAGRGSKVAIDIGGTFTDLAAVDASGRLVLSKVLTTPRRLQHGVLEAVASSGLEPGEVAAFVHGTTVVINAVTERRGARTALLTTLYLGGIVERVERCRAEVPALREVDGAVVACHRAEDVLADGLGPSG